MSNQKSINVRAKDSSVLSGGNAIIQSLPLGIDIPQVTVTDNGQRTEGCSCSTTVDIEAMECDISVADQTAVLVYIDPQEETVPAACESLPEEESITRVTGRTVEGTNNLHFFVHEHGKHIQIGQCCLIVEIHVNDQMMEKLRAEGTLQVNTKIGGSLVTITWRDLRTDKEEMKARIKVQLQSSLTEQLQAWEKAALQDLVDNECDKCRQLVSFLFTKIEGHLTDISPGCLQLTVVFTDRKKLDRGTSPEALSAIREFLDSLLLTQDLESATSDLRFSITVLDQEVYDSTATIYSRERTTTITEERQSDLTGMKGEISGEMMRQDELTSQMSENIQKVVQKALSEELAHFRLEQTKILREAVEEVLPEMEQRMFEKISGKSQVQDIQGMVVPQRVLRIYRENPPIWKKSGNLSAVCSPKSKLKRHYLKLRKKYMIAKSNCPRKKSSKKSAMCRSQEIVKMKRHHLQMKTNMTKAN
uniref:Uncharacterized protein LOC111131629 n=1 Tax=Crassostrea virginica TaxID=6565 RepID=A0A8B8E6B9_CRAVI|nr:uncharacterized protein LOC111131629 [Crassostrea virginica]XP_022334952.1 uncharacterized protein LOC111131629 [Crassostrea virginica]